MAAETPPRPAGLKAIIAYKLVKVPVMFTLAAILTFWPQLARDWMGHLVWQLSSGGVWLAKVGHWLAEHGLASLQGGRWVAWVDGAFTVLEVVLLLSGKSWGEWLVVGGLGALVPVEIYSIGRRPSWLKAGVLLGNVVIVAYLLYHRLKAHRLKSGHPEG